MNPADIIELKAHAVFFLSEYDEEAFFAWLDKLTCISSYKGEGDILRIQVESSAVDEYALRELLALFYRYGVDMKQLTAFDRKDFFEWFHDKEKYWHKSVFEIT